MKYFVISLPFVIFICVCRQRMKMDFEEDSIEQITESKIEESQIPPRDDYTDSDDEIEKQPRVYPYSQEWIARGAPRRMIYRDPYGPRNGKYEEDE